MKYTANRYAISINGTVIENTISNTKHEAIERAINLNSKRTNIHDKGWYRDVTIKPTWKELKESGYKVTHLLLKEK